MFMHPLTSLISETNTQSVCNMFLKSFFQTRDFVCKRTMFFFRMFQTLRFSHQIVIATATSIWLLTTLQANGRTIHCATDSQTVAMILNNPRSHLQQNLASRHLQKRSQARFWTVQFLLLPTSKFHKKTSGHRLRTRKNIDLRSG